MALNTLNKEEIMPRIVKNIEPRIVDRYRASWDQHVSKNPNARATMMNSAIIGSRIKLGAECIYRAIKNVRRALLLPASKKDLLKLAEALKDALADAEAFDDYSRVDHAVKQLITMRKNNREHLEDFIFYWATSRIDIVVDLVPTNFGRFWTLEAAVNLHCVSPSLLSPDSSDGVMHCTTLTDIHDIENDHNMMFTLSSICNSLKLEAEAAA
jgi:Holliday junction resolvase RusA-like endonuclease